MTRSADSELIQAFSGVISHPSLQKQMRVKTESWIKSRLSLISPRDQDIALLQWLEHGILLRACEEKTNQSSFLLALSRFGRAYARTRDKMRLGFEQEEADGCFERVSENRRIASHEWIGFVPLHRRGRLGDLSIIAEGGRSHVSLEYSDLFQALLSLRPEGFYLLHNHPSGDLIPSREDCILTFEVQSLAHDLKLKFLGHGIVSSQGNHWIVV